MNLSKYVSAIRNDITSAAALGDEKAQQIAAALANALEPSVRLALMNALSDLAADVSKLLEDRTVEVRLNGSNVEVVVLGPGGGSAPNSDPLADFEQAIDDVTGNISRVTLRLVDHIKARAEEAANANGVSLNSWLGQAIRGALRDQSRWAWEPPHRRPSGWSGWGSSWSSSDPGWADKRSRREDSRDEPGSGAAGPAGGESATSTSAQSSAGASKPTETPRPAEAPPQSAAGVDEPTARPDDSAQA